MKLTQLKAIAKQNKVPGRSIMNKPEFIVSLKEKGLILEGNIRTEQTTKTHPVNDTRYDYFETHKTESKTCHD